MKNLFSKGSQCLGDESSLNVDMEENHTVESMLTQKNSSPTNAKFQKQAST